MRISTKGRYALRFLIDLANHQSDGYVTLNAIAERQGISKKYLEQIVSLFSDTEILSASRGASGGYRLNQDPRDITVSEILRISEGGFAPVPCLENGGNGCERNVFCPTLPIWKGLQDCVEEYLSNISLQAIIDQTFAEKQGQ